jgi:potassium-transporting ATPase KdpC subunit
MRSGWVAQCVAALRVLLVMTVVTGLLYPLVVLAVAQLPGLRHQANGSLVTVGSTTVGSSQIGQSFTDDKGAPLVQYFQSRPSAAGTGYDPTATSASNLGPENVVDTLPDPAIPGDSGKQSLLTQVCARSRAIGLLENVDGRRPYCTDSGVGAVLAVFFAHGSTGAVTRVVSVDQACPATPFLTTYHGVAVTCARFGEDWSKAVVVPVRGSAPASPAVPADAVTASGSGLDPDISLAYARLQAPRVARARGVSTSAVLELIGSMEQGRALGFMGEPVVDVLELNLALDREHPYHG